MSTLSVANIMRYYDLSYPQQWGNIIICADRMRMPENHMVLVIVDDIDAEPSIPTGWVSTQDTANY